MRHAVRIWEEPLILPTYPVPGPDPQPQLLDRRVHRGDSGRVYPCAVTDLVTDTPEPRAWRAVHLLADVDMRPSPLALAGGVAVILAAALFFWYFR